MRKAWIWAAVILAGASRSYAQAPVGDGDPPAAVVSSSPSTSARAISVDSRGLWISTSDRSTYVQVHGYAQADNRMFVDALNREGYDQFLFRRIRPLFEGTLFRAIDFRFMPDFGQNNPQIQEVFLEFKSIPFAKLRVGKFKEPLGLEVLRSDRELTFAERSIASDLVPLRYMGAQVGGAMLSNTITYEIGYFNGSSDGANGNFQWLPANEGAARVFLHPFAPTAFAPLRNLGLGVAGSAGSQHGSIAGLKTPGQTTFFKYSSSAVADGQHNRLTPQAYYYWGPLGLMGEYMLSSQEVLNKGKSRRLRNEAWQLAGSFVVTGEKNGYDGVRPKYSFEPNKGIRHLGAFELTARYSPLSVDPNSFPLFANPQTAAQRAIERSFGMNWYLNRFVKLVSDYEMTRFRTVAANSTLHSENVLMSRIQLAF
jgi:phosphate-selective porin OprO/OprP